MQVQDAYTSSEIIRILRDRGTEEVAINEDPENLNSEVVTIDCKQGDLEFKCYLLGSDPFFIGMILTTTIFCVTSSPFRFANSLNSQMLNATFRVVLNDEDEVVKDDDGDSLMIADTSVVFDGGVTPEHIERQISLWLEDVIEGFGLDESILETSQIQGVVGDELKEMGIAEQIKWVLEIDALPRTARQLASFLMKDKQEVNSVLYRRTDLFCQDKAQPPRWSLVRPGS